MTSSRSDRDIWSRTLLLLVLGLVCYGLPGAVIAALPLPLGEQPVLRIQGSNTVGAKLAPMLISGFFESQGLREISVQPGSVENEQRVNARNAAGRSLYAHVAAHGTGTGFVGLKAGTTDLAAASRPIKSSEHAELSALGDLRQPQAEQVIAIDGLAIIVHPDNPLNALNTTQVARLFAGEISNWKELGGLDLTVQLHARDDRSGTYDTFKELVLAAQGKSLAAQAQRYESNDQLSRAITTNRGAIGFVGLASVGKAKALAIADGESQPMPPNTALIATEDYPLSRRLFMYAKPEGQSPWTQAYIEFIHSPAGQRIVDASGYVGQHVEAIRQAPQAGMPGFYRQLSEQAQRLTVNFRFDEGSAQLDNKAQRDIGRVIDYLREHGKLTDSVALVGFGDAKNDSARAALLSKLRAMAVRRELAKHGAYVREINGMGAELPVASNEGDGGRVKNRRVEIWIY
ncbi:phosphate ABC transporter substrate-binding/OmpA family protein [Stutzerimonas stutzeri]|uniref:phosphate ABC transporter substrate-binding/OmpA family protein n=1 Tax=Stutzerimonas sp. S1 TaxID=3030652 RepID=UPI002225355D|nr:phosphate ABC transporter substrate-binding/OmpA family protein [Stutzerimonas sp. S1]MCW3148083.1 phosphate ABC transporter substrate-binding/OmpA family protein [Stutzerimonas sp. S1]